MINYDKPDDDPIVAEVRRARAELAAEFNYDLNALFAEMQRRQQTHGDKYAKLEPLLPVQNPSPRQAG